MGLRINTNLAAIAATRSLSRVSGSLRKNFEHLATGSRISRASDDAAGVAISSRLRARVRSLDQAARNANDGISLVQVADGALGELEDILSRMRELSVQAANGTNTANDRTALNNEFTNLRDTVDAVANSTKFNGIALLNTQGSLTFQVGADTTANVDTFVVSTYDATGSGSLAISTMDIGGTTQSTVITAIDAAINTVATFRSTLGADSNRLATTAAQLLTRSENLSAANSRIQDVDVAKETAQLSKNSILQQAAISVLAQANTQPTAALSLLGGR